MIQMASKVDAVQYLPLVLSGPFQKPNGCCFRDADSRQSGLRAILITSAHLDHFRNQVAAVFLGMLCQPTTGPIALLAAGVDGLPNIHIHLFLIASTLLGILQMAATVGSVP